MQSLRAQQAELESLRAENERLRRALEDTAGTTAALEAGRVGTWSWDVATGAVKWSANVETLFGLEPGSFPGTAEAFFQLVHPEDRARFDAAMSRALDGDGAFDVVHRALRPNGSVPWMACVGAVERDEAGRARRLHGSVRELVRMSASALDESLERYRGVVDSLDEGVVVFADTGRMVAANASAARILGVATSELIGRTLHEMRWPIVGADDTPLRADDLPAMRTLATGERHTNVSVGFARPDGSVVWLSINTEPLFRPSEQRPYAVVASFHDVTERRRLLEQLVQSQKMDSLGRLAGGVAHDFNNLLTVILSYAQLLSSTMPVGDPRREDVTQIQRAGDSATRLVRQLLAFARQQPTAPRNVDVGRLVQESRRLLDRLVGDDVQVVIEADEALPSVRVDPTQFEQVVLNLAVNARDAMPRGGRFCVRVRVAELEAPSHESGLQAGQHVVVEVSDTGHGMSEEVRRRAFEPFFTTKAVDRGTGLGLATCWGIVKQAGGHVELESGEGAGTLVRITLPVVSGRAEHGVAGARAAPVGRQGETVLVVEDDPLVRGVVHRVLMGLGYRVLSAAHGQDALEQARGLEGPADLVVADLVLPRLGGREVWRDLRNEGLARRVLFISGRNVENETDPVLGKPFSSDELARRVREALDRPVGR